MNIHTIVLGIDDKMCRGALSWHILNCAWHIKDFIRHSLNFIRRILWSGNYIVGNDGRAWLIDPAVYVGHSEADLAMTELFGRFPSDFYNAYSSVNPIDPGYKDRRDLYNLYHLINHLNLFGDTYYSAVMSTVLYYVG